MENITVIVKTRDLKNDRNLKRLYLKAYRSLLLMLIGELILVIEIVMCSREITYMLLNVTYFTAKNMIIYLLIPIVLFIYFILFLPYASYCIYIKQLIKEYGESYVISFMNTGIWVNDKFIPWKKGLINIKTNYGVARISLFKIMYLVVIAGFTDEEQKQIFDWMNA